MSSEARLSENLKYCVPPEALASIADRLDASTDAAQALDALDSVSMAARCRSMALSVVNGFDFSPPQPPPSLYGEDFQD